MKKSAADVMTLLLLPACIFLLVHCRKEYSYEGGPKKNTALYTLKTAGDSCTGSVLKGNYYKGVALGSTHSVQVLVNVISAGSYSISTNTANGFYFSATGVFTQTGVQSVTLAGNGTPSATGQYRFTGMATATCSFSVSVTSAPVAMAAFTLAGAPNNCQPVEIDGSYLAGKILSSANYILINVQVTAVGAYTITTDTLDGVFFAASGVFTATGNTPVKLYGTGIPTAARNLSFTPHTANSNCSFALSITDNDPLATYVLESGFGNPNPCIYTVAGNYVAATAVTAGNTVTISVFVTVAGNFTIVTNTVNGLLFSWSGSFTGIGAQKVVLAASGTPTAKGIFSFTPEIVGPHPLGGQVCAFNVQVK